MATKEFDPKFQELFSAMVEIALEFVNRNKEEVDCVYIYGSMEDDCQFYNVFYNINGKLIELHLLNTISKEQYDLSDERVFKLLELGADFLEETSELFEGDEREVPTLMKMTYSPKTGAFDSDINYDLHYSDHPERTEVDGFEEWFEEIKSSL